VHDSLQVDRVGTALLCLAIVVVPLVILGLPWQFFPLAFAGFVICNFGGHAAIHRSLFPCTTPLRRVVNEFILCGAYMCHLMNYQLIVPAHLLHHSWGRTDPLSRDIVTEKPSVFMFGRYYTSLLFIPAVYWSWLSLWRLFRRPFSKIQTNRDGKRFHFELPYIVPQALVLGFMLASLIANPVGFLLYWFVSAVFWNVMQNVAHYGLSGFDNHTERLAARTYFVGPIVKRLTYGALAHLPHHVFMDIPGLALDHPRTIAAVESEIESQVFITYGFAAYLRDVFRQFKGPVMIKNLTTDWLVPNKGEIGRRGSETSN
jgi:fatty acid desaturase